MSLPSTELFEFLFQPFNYHYFLFTIVYYNFEALCMSVSICVTFQVLYRLSARSDFSLRRAMAIVKFPAALSLRICLSL